MLKTLAMILNLLQEVLFLLDYQHTCLKTLNAVSHETERKYKMLAFKLIKKIQAKLRHLVNKSTNTLLASEEHINDGTFDHTDKHTYQTFTDKHCDVEMLFDNRQIDKRKLQRVIITAPANMSKINILDGDESCGNNDEAVLDEDLKQTVDKNNTKDEDAEELDDDSMLADISAMEIGEKNSATLKFNKEDLSENKSEPSPDLGKGMGQTVAVIQKVHNMLKSLDEEEVVEEDHEKIEDVMDQEQKNNLKNVNIDERIQKFRTNAFKIKVELSKEGQSQKLEMIKQKLPVKCAVCNELVKAGGLKERMSTHPVTVYKCGVCFEKYSSDPGVRNHIKQVHLKKLAEIIQCDKCGGVFASRSLLLTHKYEKHELKCDVCNKVYKSPYCMKRHKLLGREKESSVQCEICYKIISFKKHLTRHMNTHADKNKFQCMECSKRFFSMRSLRDHDKCVHHADQSQLTCEYCNHVFFNKWNLAVHRRIHTGEKLFICDICGAAFNQNVERKLHDRKHAPNAVKE